MKLLKESGSPMGAGATTALCTLRLSLNPLLWNRDPVAFIGFFWCDDVLMQAIGPSLNSWCDVCMNSHQKSVYS